MEPLPPLRGRSPEVRYQPECYGTRPLRHMAVAFLEPLLRLINCPHDGANQPPLSRCDRSREPRSQTGIDPRAQLDQAARDVLHQILLLQLYGFYYLNLALIY
ncbi:MAG: hypothetical protein ACRENW_09055, partial [Thermodesulfobacteriota bacterium]